MILRDTVELVTTSPDMYGDRSIQHIADVRCLFIQRSAMTHDANADSVTSDAVVYLDPTNEVVLENTYRLEGMHIIANPLGQPQSKSWYRIIGVNVGQRKLLDNKVENIHCDLQKVAGIAYGVS